MKLQQISGIIVFLLLISVVPSFAYRAPDGTLHSSAQYYRDSYTYKYSAPFSSTEEVLRQEISGVAEVPTKDADKTSCELVAGLRDRIQCRLDADVENTGLFEPCKVYEFPIDRMECAIQFQSVTECFDFVGTVKDTCFRNHAGLVAPSFGSIRYTDDSAEREYVLFLLLDAQNSVETSYEQGMITSEDATAEIAQIIRIQQRILLRYSLDEAQVFLGKIY